MEVSCSIDLIVSFVGWNKGAYFEGFLRASINSSAALFAMSTIDKVGNFLLVGKNSTMSSMRSAAILVRYIVHKW